MSNSINADFRTLLLTNATIVNLVNNRIAQLPIQDDEPLPWIGYQRTSEQHDGLDCDGSAGIKTTEFEVKCKAASQEAADQLASEIKGFIGHRGTVGDHEFLCVDVFDADNTEDETFPPGSDSTQVTVALRVEVIHDGP